MKNINKKFVLSTMLVGAVFLQQNLYAGFFDQLSSGIKSSISGNSSNTHQKAAQTETPPAKKEVVATGTVSKTVNVRSGPGTKNAKVGSVSPASTITILKTQGKWLQIEADTAGGFVEGWVYKPLVNIGVSTVSSNGVTIVGKKETRQNVYYAGYSKEFQKIKQMMASGNLKGVEKFYTDREAEVLKKNQTKWQAMEEIGLLRWMERGTLYLDKRDVEKSIKSFGNAEDILIVRQKDSKASDLLTSIASFTAETVTGNEEFQEYPGEGYEKVLMLNYKSISFLLDGERQAYNVARRAIDWQNMEKARFRDEIEAAKKETKKAEKDIKDKDAASNSEWKASYKKLDKIANKVPSAFVNPFGYYVTGMIQEYEAKKDASLMDNARIAYEKALKLNPKSKVLKQAVKDMKRKKSPGNKRLLHVVVADGFAPEKKMLVYNFPSGNGVVPIKLPIYEPVASKVARVEVQTTGGKRLATLSSVADVEAICLRNQKDSEAFRSLRMTVAIARAVGVNQATRNLGLFGNLLSSAVNDMAAPDMRSWMSLPAKLQAARLYISKNTKKLKIVSFDSRGRRLASKTVNINNKSDAFVYARSIDKQLYVNGSETMWTAK